MRKRSGAVFSPAQIPRQRVYGRLNSKMYVITKTPSRTMTTRVSRIATNEGYHPRICKKVRRDDGGGHASLRSRLRARGSADGVAGAVACSAFTERAFPVTGGLERGAFLNERSCDAGTSFRASV